MRHTARPALVALLLAAAAPAAAITQGPGPSAGPASPLLPISARGAADFGGIGLNRMVS